MLYYKKEHMDYSYMLCHICSDIYALTCMLCQLTVVFYNHITLIHGRIFIPRLPELQCQEPA